MATACHQEDLLPQTQDQTNSNTQVGVFGDEMRLCLNVVAPDPVQTNTRAVDPDGKTLQTLNLFCFDANGLFLTTVSAQVKGDVDSEDQLKGTFSATIPKTTRIIHLLANQNMSLFDKDDYVYKTEDDVLSALEGSAGMMIYWARIQAPVNVSELYTDAKYTDAHDGKTIENRTEAEAFVDWITIETNPATEEHRGVPGKGNPIILLRNQAKFTIVSEDKDGEKPADAWKGDFFEVTGFVVCNTPAFGTVAPYHSDYGFPTYACSTFTPDFGVKEATGVAHNWLTEKRVTLPARKEKMSDIADVSSSREQYIFETSNLSTDPVDLILRGRNRKADGTLEQERYYYRVNILDEDWELLEILRNHHYEIHIKGNLSNGCPTFNEALVAPPTNNVWISISDEVNSVRNNSYVLTVEKTSAIVEAAYEGGQPNQSELKLNFSIEALYDDKPVDTSKIKVYWVEDDQKVSNTYNPSLVLDNKVSYEEETGKGVITLAMNKLVDGSEYERGSIIVKYGHLQRKIRIVLMRTKQFIPAWVSSEVYGTVTGNTESRSNVTVIFTIPDTCPEELFPMDVLVTTNGLDGRAATGQVLPIVREGEDGYGKNFTVYAPDSTKVSDIGYKYKVRVTEPGQHRVYFENILNMEAASAEYVVLEAEHFDFATKMVTYVLHKNEIVLPNLLGYTINPDAAEKEEVKYILVPQKRFHPVVFDIALKKDGAYYGTITSDLEFLLYSSNLDHYADNDNRLGGNKDYGYVPYSKSNFDCTFKPYEQKDWSTGGRIFGFYPRPGMIVDSNQCFQIYMETNKPKSAEVVRIASNQVGSPQVKDAEASYDNMTFRSVTFEFANYRPFRFAAQMKVGNNAPQGNYVADDATSGTQNPEVVDNIQFEYLPSEEIAISFDVTSFKAEDGTTVDPFGHAFEIFIDAPMLELEYGKNKSVGELKTGVNFEDIKVPMFDKKADGEGYIEEKPKLEDLGNGRFVYRVDASGDKESQYWTDFASKLNKPLITPPSFGYGERKTLYFKKKSIVSQGTITISANPDHVTYHSKSFNISNAPIQGRIGYVPEGSSEPVQVPAGQFVSFARVYDGSRIGTLTVKSTNEDAPEAPTYYELRLRAEYDFNWVNDPIKLMCSIDGKYYSAELEDLATLYNTPNKTIVLKYDEGQNQ